MTRVFVSPRQVLLIAAAVIVIACVSLSSAFAEGPSKEDSARQKAKWTMGIAQEQIKRGLFKEARQRLLSIEDTRQYLSASGIAELDAMLQKIDSDLKGRDDVLKAIEQSDTLAAQKRFKEAKELLDSVKGSAALTDEERAQVGVQIKAIDKSYEQYSDQMEDQFKKSISLYKAGQLDQARKGFSDVAISGVSVSSKGKTPQDYIRLIDDSLNAKIASEKMVKIAEDKAASDAAEAQKDDAKKTQQMQELYDECVKLYKEGQLEQAKTGFSQVAQSGVKVKTSKGNTPKDFITLIEKSQSMQAKAVDAVQNASKMYQQGSYDKAKKELLQVKKEYWTYLSSQQQSDLGTYIENTDKAIAAKTRIAKDIKAGKKLASDKKYQPALVKFEAVVNSPYLSSEERLEIVSCIEEVNSSVLADAELARKKEMEDVFAGSVDALKAGDKAKARAGFAEVAASNLDISRKGLTAADYIAKIDAPQPEPVVVIPEPVVVKVDEVTEVKIEAAPAVEVIAAPVENKPRTFNDEKERQRLVQISYTQAIITDAIKTANEHLAHNEFALAKQAIAKAFSVVNKNKILLGEELFRQNYGQLSLMNDQISDAEKTYQDAQEAEAAKAAKALQQSIREEVDMAREASIEEALDNAGIFVRQQKYDAAMGQVDKVLALDKNNNEALTLKYMLEDNMNWREQIETRRRADEAEIKAFHRADEAGIPNSDIITHPKNWKEIVERRKEEEMSGQNELDVEVNKQLDETVDLSSLTSDTTLEDAIEILVNAVEPPLQIIVLWTDLENNAFIQQDTAIGISGERLRSIPLRTGLERVIQGVSGGLTDLAYSLENGIITIATKETLPEKYEQRIYDVSELSSAPFQDRSGMGGGMGGMSGGMGGMSGGMGGMSGGMSGGMGGMSGGMGGMSGGMGGMSGGMGGMSGGMGGMSGGMGGGSNSFSRVRELIYNITQIEPDTWDEDYQGNNNTTGGGNIGGGGSTTLEDEITGEGRITQFGTSMLIVWQTPEVHEKIKQLIDELKVIVDNQVMIETRFILVDENWLENIGIDVEMVGLGDGHHFTFNALEQESNSIVAPLATKISSSLGGSVLSALTGGVTYADDLQVTLLLDATQSSSHARSLSAPMATVLSGEPATLNVTKERNYVSNATVETTTLATGTNLRDFSSVVNELDVLQSGIQMSVTPTISSDKKYVLLRISAVLQDELESSFGTTTTFVPDGAGGVEEVTASFELPLTQTTNLQTRVTVPDMGTVLLGGLTLTAEREIESGVPILNKIPIISRFFSNRSEIKDKQILLILVKPTIILKDEAEADAIAALE